MSTMGPLVGSESASAASVNIADRWDDITYIKWPGSWEGGERGSTGRAELFLARMSGSAVRVEFSIYGSYMGSYTYWIDGQVYGNMIQLKRERSEVTLFLSEEDGELVLSGNYEVLTGPNAGETGTYHFKKPK
jgi:hypothetical protein